MTPPIIESVQECRPKKRKRVQDKIPRKRIKVSTTIRAATTCQDHIKRKMTEEVEGCSTPTKKKKELLQQVQTKETSSSMDISSGWLLWSTLYWQNKVIQKHGFHLKNQNISVFPCIQPLLLWETLWKCTQCLHRNSFSLKHSTDEANKVHLTQVTFEMISCVAIWSLHVALKHALKSIKNVNFALNVSLFAQWHFMTTVINIHENVIGNMQIH